MPSVEESACVLGTAVLGVDGCEVVDCRPTVDGRVARCVDGVATIAGRLELAGEGSVPSSTLLADGFFSSLETLR